MGVNVEVLKGQSEEGTKSGVDVEVLEKTKDKNKVKISAQDAHFCLGHANKETCVKTVKALGWEIDGEFGRCESCLKAKAKQKEVKKESGEMSTKTGERIFMDITPMTF